MKQIIFCLIIFLPVPVAGSDFLSDKLPQLRIFDDAVSEVVGETLDAEILATGMTWAEGPAWHSTLRKVYFSDVPENKMYSWSEAEGKKLEFDPSGTDQNIEGFREPGTNGIVVIPETGDLLVANHGLRALQTINPISKERVTLTGLVNGKKFNSPNDITLAKDGTIYFTDPPYGLADWNNNPLKEMPFNGVYKRSAGGVVSLVDDTLTMPNGIHLSPDENYLYVAVSDFDNPAIYRYIRGSNGQYADRELWFDAKPYIPEKYNGITDGMAVRSDGMVFASGPGGIFIIAPNGNPLGLIAFDRPAANCTLGENEKILFITVSDKLVRVRLP